MLPLCRILEAERPLVQNASPVRSQRAGRERRDLVGQLLRFVERAAGLNETRHEADPQRFFGGYRAARKDHVQSPALSAQSVKPDSAEVDQRNADATVE